MCMILVAYQLGIKCFQNAVCNCIIIIIIIIFYYLCKIPMINSVIDPSFAKASSVLNFFTISLVECKKVFFLKPS